MSQICAFANQLRLKHLVSMLIAMKCKRESGYQKKVFESLDYDQDGALGSKDLLVALLKNKDIG